MSHYKGESIPVTKRPGEEVIGATINKSGSFRYRATKVGKDTTLQIIKMVESAQASKAPIQRIADRISNYFVPIVFLVAITSFIFWFYIGPVASLAFDNDFCICSYCIMSGCIGFGRSNLDNGWNRKRSRERHVD
jgi:cation transport ATPase